MISNNKRPAHWPTESELLAESANMRNGVFVLDNKTPQVKHTISFKKLSDGLYVEQLKTFKIEGYLTNVTSVLLDVEDGRVFREAREDESVDAVVYDPEDFYTHRLKLVEE